MSKCFKCKDLEFFWLNVRVMLLMGSVLMVQEINGFLSIAPIFAAD